jgi:hypothetical protein
MKKISIASAVLLYGTAALQIKAGTPLSNRFHQQVFA